MVQGFALIAGELFGNTRVYQLKMIPSIQGHCPARKLVVAFAIYGDVAVHPGYGIIRRIQGPASMSETV